MIITPDPSPLDEIKLETFVNNVDTIKNHRFNQQRPIVRINPLTGQVEQRFDNRLSAARWIAQHVLEWEGDIERKALSITGNMHMCISNGWKSYGYLWQYVKVEAIDHVDVTTAVPLKAESVWVLGKFGETPSNSTKLQQKVFPSIRAAARATGLDDRRVKRLMVEGGKSYDGYVFRAYNVTPTTRTFRTITEFSIAFGLTDRRWHTLHRLLRDDNTLNNTKIVIDRPMRVKRDIKIFQNRAMVGQFETFRAAGAFLGVTSGLVSTYANTSQKINGLYSVTVVVEKRAVGYGFKGHEHKDS